MSDTSTSTHKDVTAIQRKPGPGIMPGQLCWGCRTSTPYGRKRGRLKLWHCVACADAIDAKGKA